jgi:hypothetical protein
MSEIKSDYWAVRGNSIQDAINDLENYTKDDLIKLIINNRLNDFISHYSDLADGEEGHHSGKRIPYIGWHWRSVDFVGLNIPVGNCGDFIGFMENNKWDHDERMLTKDEAEKVVNIIWQAKIISEEGSCLSEIKAKLDELWDLFQTFKI